MMKKRDSEVRVGKGRGSLEKSDVLRDAEPTAREPSQLSRLSWWGERHRGFFFASTTRCESLWTCCDCLNSLFECSKSSCFLLTHPRAFANPLDPFDLQVDISLQAPAVPLSK